MAGSGERTIRRRRALIAHSPVSRCTVAAGAEVLYPVADQFYCERGGRLRDPFGQQWMMSKHIEDVPSEERGLLQSVTAGDDPATPGRWPPAVATLMPRMSANPRRYVPPEAGLHGFCAVLNRMICSYPVALAGLILLPDAVSRRGIAGAVDVQLGQRLAGGVQVGGDVTEIVPT
jgi:hypothetical protein